MKRILMRAPASPFRNPTAVEGIKEDLISTNSGNLVFPSALSRLLLSDEVQIDYTKANHYLSAKEIDRINAQYDSFVIPLANPFRNGPKALEMLEILTDTVQRLKIPCIIAGVGVQCGLHDRPDAKRPFDMAASRLIKAVLNKSAIVGVRGEVTARYLEHLGFRPERDFTVIGCPSMFWYGPDLPKPRELTLSEDTKISTNCKAELPQKIHDFLGRVRAEYPEHWYVPQNLYELKTLFAGMPLWLRGPVPKEKLPEGYPADASHPLYREDRVRGFVSVGSWMQFLSEKDLSLGTRIHGNIVAVLSGTPAFIIAPDTRVKELAEYHHIPHITLEELDPGTDLAHLIGPVSFKDVTGGHEMRFLQFQRFLHQNGLRTIYDGGRPERVPFDEKMQEISFLGTVGSYLFADEVHRQQALDVWTAEVMTGDARIRKLERYTGALKAARHPVDTARRSIDRLICGK